MKRNIGKRGYCAIQANIKAIKRGAKAVAYPVMTLETIETIETIELLAPFKYLVLTITTDNGKEFAYYKAVSQSLEYRYFFQIYTAHGSTASTF